MAFVIIVLVLLIPLTAIVLDSQIGQALANRLSGQSGGEEREELSARVQELEAEVRYLSSSVESLREETEFVRSLIEGPKRERPELGAGD
ncbi:MAG: hypothetical protein ACE5JR_07600 [Gemmatimonadota bacterium]